MAMAVPSAMVVAVVPVVVAAEYGRSAVTVKDSLTSASPVVKEFRSKSHCCVFAIHRGTCRANDPCPILPGNGTYPLRRVASRRAESREKRLRRRRPPSFFVGFANYLNCKFAGP